MDMDPAGRQALADAVKHLHGCECRFVEWQTARDEWRGRLVFDRPVAVFDLVKHPQAARAFAWSEAIVDSGKRRFFAVLAVGPIDTATAAVRASLVADTREKR